VRALGLAPFTAARPVAAEPGSWQDFYSAFAGSVEHGGPPPVDPWDAVATLDVLDAARRSATTGEVVQLSVTS
jgi:predicted dehydrogenase